MTIKATVVDYGMGNILSVSRALEHCGADVTLSSDPNVIAKAEYLVLPGVGAFGAAVSTLKSRGLVEPICSQAASGRPFLGICIGMQLMLTESEEFGTHEGLRLIDGRVMAIPDTGADEKPHTVPHIGWSAINPLDDSWDRTVLADTSPGAEVYFVHSFHAVPVNDKDILAVTDYDGRQITAAICRNNMTGLQFHPEKSASLGLNILDRFLRK